MNIGIDDSQVLDNISKITNTEYSEEQLAILKNHGGMCILACAGSGKTTLLTHLIAKRITTGEIEDPSRLLCTTYSKSGATEMETRLTALLDSLGIKRKVTVKTLHAVYYSLLKDLGYNVKIIDGGTKAAYIRDACKDADIKLQDEDYATLDGIFGYQINNLLSDTNLFKSYAYTLREEIPLKTYSFIRSQFAKKKQDNGMMDFDDMQLFVYRLLCHPDYGTGVKEYCNRLWKDIYVDEAQDVSKIQFEILKYLITDANRLVFIGDDDQCIYQWRGADPSIITNICGIYPDMSLFTLTTNYRCYGDIVRQAAVGIKFNATRSEKGMEPFNEGGSIRVCDSGSSDLYTMSKYAHKYIKDLIMVGGVKPSDIAVLSRNNAHLCLLNNMLFSDGIYCATSDDMKFTYNGIYKKLIGVVSIGKNTTNGNVAGDNYWRCCNYLSAYNSKLLGRIQANSGLCVKDTLAYMFVKYGGYSKNDFDKIQIKSLPGLAEAQLETFWYGLKDETRSNLLDIYNLIDKCTPEECICGLIDMFRMSKAYQYKTDERIRLLDGICDYMKHILREKGMQEFDRYIYITEQYEHGSMATISPRVSLSTMHGSKGREWNNVVIFADDNISFPSFTKIQTSINEGVPESDIMSMIDEDRRLHYVAMTRAKKSLAIFTDKANPGVYTLEALNCMDFGKQNNYNIIMMAQHGIQKEILEKAGTELFDSSSKYKLNIALGKSAEEEVSNG